MSTEYIIETEKVIMRTMLERALISLIEREHKKEKKMTRAEIEALLLPRRIKSIDVNTKTKTIVIHYE